MEKLINEIQHTQDIKNLLINYANNKGVKPK